jgi:hypothetical protein
MRPISCWATPANSVAHLKNSPGWLVLLAVATLLCGCFQATNKFYADSDVIVDSRFEGRFEPRMASNDPAVPCLALVTLDHNKRYSVTVQEGQDWVKLEAVLFRAGTNLFVDISRLQDSRKHNNNGDKPSFLELLRRGTADKNHVAIRFEFVEDGVEAQIAAGVPFVRAVNKDPTLKLRKVDDHFEVLLDQTDRLRSFLVKIGDDRSVFMEKVRWLRTKQ